MNNYICYNEIGCGQIQGPIKTMFTLHIHVNYVNVTVYFWKFE